MHSSLRNTSQTPRPRRLQRDLSDLSERKVLPQHNNVQRHTISDDVAMDAEDDESDADRVEATYGSISPPYHPDDPIPPLTHTSVAPISKYSFRTDKRGPSDRHLPTIGPPKKKKGNPTICQMDVLQSILEIVERHEIDNAAASTQQTTLLEQLLEVENSNAARLERLITLIQECQTRIGVAETRIRTLQETRRDEATQQPAATGTSTQTHPITPHVVPPREGGGGAWNSFNIIV